MPVRSDSTDTLFDQGTTTSSTRSENGRSNYIRQQSVAAGLSTASARKVVEEESIRGVIFPWSKRYRIWWSVTVICAILTIFSETFQIAFAPGGNSSVLQYFLTGIFVVDIGVTFFLTYNDEQDALVCDRRLIAQHYLRFMFWIDFIGVFPFYVVALACAGLVGQDTNTSQYLALFGLLKLVRLHRVKQLFDFLQYNVRVSFIWLTLTRNVAAALIWSHFSACVLYFIAREYGFDPDRTWIGDQVESMNIFERYVTSLYWAIVTFVSVGYGDYSPTNSTEQIWGIIYMLLNIIISAWIIGSMTLLIVKQDEKTGLYRDSMQILKQYATMNNFDRGMQKSLKMQLKLHFKHREIGDEQVLKQFPSAIRRKVLRRLYLRTLLQTKLMKDTRPQFVDAFLNVCTVEIFSPGEEILQRGSICSDLYFLVEGSVTRVNSVDGTVGEQYEPGDMGTSIGDSEHPLNASRRGGRNDTESGDFINEIGFFTESSQVDTIRTKTVCKTLTMSRSSYKSIAEDHPGSVGKILQNLVKKIEASAVNSVSCLQEAYSTNNVHDGTMDATDISYQADVNRTVVDVQTESALMAVQDLIKMHMNKQKDENTTRFLFAASRGDTSMIALMCDQGFDPNSADYDCRTALMVAAMKGFTEAVALILDYNANPNLVDMHGTSALYEAVKNAHEDTIDTLLEHHAELSMDDNLAASTLCQTVFDRDIATLRRLLRAGIQVNASDYDNRTGAHIAAAEGNLEAIKVLVEFGADLSLQDRWKNTVEDEAQRSQAKELLEYLDSLKTSPE
jgi:ankyrin repeat protein/CRP-like cAMP-binding protein